MVFKHWKHNTQDSNPSEKINKWGEPYDCPSLLPREFQAAAQGGKTQSEPSSLPELHSQSWESGGYKVERIHRAECQRGESCTETKWGLFLSLQLGTNQICEWGTHPSRGKDPLERSRHTIFRLYTGPGIIHVLSSQGGKILYYTDHQEECPWDFPGGPVVKTLPSNAGGVGSIPGQTARIPHASQPKKPKHKTEDIL